MMGTMLSIQKMDRYQGSDKNNRRSGKSHKRQIENFKVCDERKLQKVPYMEWNGNLYDFSKQRKTTNKVAVNLKPMTHKLNDGALKPSKMGRSGWTDGFNQ